MNDSGSIGSTVRVTRASAITVLLSVAVATIGLALLPRDAWAQLPVLYHDFENNTTRTIFENAVELAINAGSGPISRAGGSSTVSGVAGAGIFNGGAANGQAATGSAWSSVTADPGTAATDYYQFTCNTTGLSQISVTVDNQASATGPAVVGLLYSTKGVTFSPTTVGPTGNAAFLAGGSSFDLSGIPAVDNQPTVTFRLYAYAGGAADRVGRSAFGSGGTFRIDNLTVRAIRFTQTLTLLSPSAVGVGIRSGTAFNPTYANLTVDGAGAIVAMNGGSALTLSGATQVSNGTFRLNNVFTTTGNVNIASTGILDLNNRTLNFSGSTITNDGLLNGPLSTQPAARLSFVSAGPQTYTGIGGTGTVADPLAGVLMNKSSGDVTLGVGSSLTVNAAILIRGGTFLNSGALTIGNSGSALSLVQVAQPLGSAQGGSFDSAPNFSIGAGGLALYYGSEPGLRTTGFEIPPARVVRDFTSDNPNGVSIAGGAVTASNSLSLSRGILGIGTGNTFTIGAGGTLARTVPGALASGTAGGTVHFAGAGTVTGTVGFENLSLGTGTVGLGPGSNVNGTLDMASGSLATGFPPTYGPAATLLYSASNALGEEWKTGTVQPGVPHDVRLSAGTVAFDPSASSSSRTVAGSLTIDNGASLVLGTLAGGDLDVKGSILTSTTGTMDANNRMITFSGAGAQTVQSGISILNWGTGRMANSGPGVTFDVPIEMLSLELVGTNIHTGPNVLYVHNSVLRTSGYVNGNLRRDATGPSASLPFDVGDAAGYAPVLVDVNGVTTNGTLEARTDAGDHGSLGGSGLDPTKSVNRNWRVLNAGTVFSGADVTFEYPASEVDGGANPLNFAVRKRDGGVWSSTAIGARTATTTQALGITSFSEFAVAELLTWTITATAGPGGSIAPPAVTVVNDGDTPMYTITPNVDFAISDVQVDGGSVGAVSNYTFAPVTTNHTIDAFFVSTAAPNAVSAVSPGGCISTVNPCASIPVVINRTDVSHIRGYSVEFQLSADLELCSTPAASVTQGSYLSAIGPTIFQVIDNGSGSYTVDAAILGVPCGQTAATGTLFNVSVKKATGGSDGTGMLTVGTVLVRDCANGPLVAGSSGPPASITIDTTAPSALAGLATSQVTSGNDGDGTTKISLAWLPEDPGTSVEVYRAGYGFYPEYDDAGGSVPAVPSYPPGAPWTLTSVTASGGTDEVAAPRDFYYFVAFVKDACGNVSAVSNLSGGTLNYHLGDVSDGFVAGQGDNQVGTADLSLLGANYGLAGPAITPVNYLDVGPTTDFSINARPTTDNVLDFEDLILFAINYATVSAPGEIADGGAPSASGSDELSVTTDGLVTPGGVLGARLSLTGSGRVQGLSVRLSWNPAIVEPVEFESGSLADGGGIALSPKPGTVDAARLGVHEAGLAGVVDLGTVRFRVKQAGDPGIGVASVIARDGQNRPVPLASSTETIAARPQVTSLLPALPNPACGATVLAFGLARASSVDLAIYSVDGRRVRNLFQGTREAGFHQQPWDGTDDAGRRLGAGVYYAALTTGDGVRQSRTVILLDR